MAAAIRPKRMASTPPMPMTGQTPPPDGAAAATEPRARSGGFRTRPSLLVDPGLAPRNSTIDFLDKYDSIPQYC
jgi:hypothetical protein